MAVQPHISGLRKAAIVMLLLGEERASEVFRHMNEEEIEALAKEMAELGPVSTQTSERVMDECRFAMVMGRVSKQERATSAAANRAERLLRYGVARSEARTNRWFGEESQGLGLADRPREFLAADIRETERMTPTWFSLPSIWRWPGRQGFWSRYTRTCSISSWSRATPAT